MFLGFSVTRQYVQIEIALFLNTLAAFSFLAQLLD
jgi:hypothetical protein